MFLQVELIARKILTDPVEILVGGRSVVNSDITQFVEIRPEVERFFRLLEVLGEWYEKGKVGAACLDICFLLRWFQRPGLVAVLFKLAVK